MSDHEFDVVVIGMGPGGEHVAEELARAGLAVARVEDRLVGGECPYWGCVPSKMMIRAANLLAEGQRIPGMAGASVSVARLGARSPRRIRDEATDNWDDTVAADRYTDLGGTLFRGQGRHQRLRAGSASARTALVARRGIVINNGTVPAIPPVPGLAGTPYWTNHEAIETEQVPQSLIVLGGGAIGAELAQVFARFGAQVTVVESAEPAAAGRRAGVGRAARRGIRPGRHLRLHRRHRGVGRSRLRVGVHRDAWPTAAAGPPRRLLVATGRRTDLAALGVGAVGLDESARAIAVDEQMVAAPGVWAIGDVVGKGAFTHMSMYHAEIVIASILGRPHHPAEYHAVPRVTFTDPEIGAVGLTEAQARDQLGTSRSASARYRRRPRLDPQGRQRRLHQARRGRRPGRARRRHLGRAHGRRGAEHADAGGARRDPGAAAARDDLRLPDVPRRGGRRARSAQGRPTR